MDTLTKQAWQGIIFFILALGVLLFVPAWSFSYWQAWAYLFVFSLSIISITLYLMRKDRALLARRVNAGSAAEKEKNQKIIQFIAQFAFIAVFLVPAIDHRFLWLQVPALLSLAADMLVVLGLWIVFLVFKENSFTSATVEIGAEQKVIATGPYAVVRHPMYSGALLMLLCTPVALGSYWGLLTFIPMCFVIVWRLVAEEKFLSKNLAGYVEYAKKTKYRLIPFIW